MENIAIVSDSSSDIPKRIVEQHGILVVPFYVTLDSNVYYKENVEITNSEFYNRLATENVFPKTSLPSIADYLEVFRPRLEAGDDILCVCLASKFSGSYQSAVNAKKIADKEFPDRTIYIVDSANATAGQALLVLEAVYMREAGLSIHAIADKLEKLKVSGRVIFTVDTLEYLQKGGRISNVAAFAGSLLNIKPILYLSDGVLVPFAKARGRKKAVAELIEAVVKEVSGDLDSYRFAVLSSESPEECAQMTVTLSTHGIKTELPPSDVGVTVGAHAGPLAIGVAFMKRYDKE